MNKYIIIILLIAISGCKSGYHLKRMAYHERMAIAKGAVITPDTVYREIKVIVPETKIDTVERFITLSDTITVIKNRIVTKIKINTRDSTVYVSTICPGDTIYKTVPVTITKNIEGSCGLPWWVYAVFGLSALIITVLIFRR
jgi:hypothetical protein